MTFAASLVVLGGGGSRPRGRVARAMRSTQLGEQSGDAAARRSERLLADVDAAPTALAAWLGDREARSSCWRGAGSGRGGDGRAHAEGGGRHPSGVAADRAVPPRPAGARRPVARGHRRSPPSRRRATSTWPWPPSWRRLGAAVVAVTDRPGDVPGVLVAPIDPACSDRRWLRRSRSCPPSSWPGAWRSLAAASPGPTSRPPR